MKNVVGRAEWLGVVGLTLLGVGVVMVLGTGGLVMLAGVVCLVAGIASAYQEARGGK